MPVVDESMSVLSMIRYLLTNGFINGIHEIRTRKVNDILNIKIIT